MIKTESVNGVEDNVAETEVVALGNVAEGPVEVEGNVAETEVVKAVVAIAPVVEELPHSSVKPPSENRAPVHEERTC